MVAADGVRELWLKFKADTSRLDLRNRLVEHYLPIVKYNAERIWFRLPEGVEFDDLVSAGVFGLINAIDGFDLSRGIKFETFCVLRIRGAILDELREMDWVPRLVRVKAGKLNKAMRAAEIKLGRTPTEDELAGQMDLPVAALERMLLDVHVSHLSSLDQKLFETDSLKEVGQAHILIDRRGVDPTCRLQASDVRALSVRGLNRAERLIVLLYYWEDLTMKQIGATLDLSESRVSQMHSSIIERLRQQLCNRRNEFVRAAA